MRRLLACCGLLLVFSSALGRGDGGLVIFQSTDGEKTATLFASPVPLRAGSVDLSVLLTDSSGRPLLDRAVRLGLVPPAEPGEAAISPCCRISNAVPSGTREMRLGVGGNRLLYELRTPLPNAGEWEVQLEWDDGSGAQGAVSGVMTVAPPAPTLAAVWPWLLWPVAGGLFLALQAAARRDGAHRTGHQADGAKPCRTKHRTNSRTPR